MPRYQHLAKILQSLLDFADDPEGVEPVEQLIKALEEDRVTIEGWKGLPAE